MASKYIVYYDLDLKTQIGDIKAIAPARITDLEQHASMEVSMEVVAEIIDGRRSPAHYCIILDEVGLPKLVLRDEYDLSQSLTQPYARRVTVGIDPQVTIVADHNRLRYHVTMVPELRQLLAKPSMIGEKVPKELEFFVVDFNNENYIYDEFVIDTKVLAQTGETEIRFVKPLPRGLAVMTNPVFTSYHFEEIDGGTENS